MRWIYSFKWNHKNPTLKSLTGASIQIYTHQRAQSDKTHRFSTTINTPWKSLHQRSHDIKYVLHLVANIYMCIFTSFFIPMHLLKTSALGNHKYTRTGWLYFLKLWDIGALYKVSHRCVSNKSSPNCQKLKIKNNCTNYFSMN